MPDTMQKRTFTLLDTAASTTNAAAATPRLGRFAVPGRTPISTPNYIPVTSRGAIPHLSPDVGAEHADVRGVYAGFEDCKLILIPTRLSIHQTSNIEFVVC